MASRKSGKRDESPFIWLDPRKKTPAVLWREWSFSYVLTERGWERID